MQEIFWWTIVCLDVVLIGVTKSGFGSGVGLMIVPIMAIAMGHVPGRGSEAALGLLLPLLIVGDLTAVWQYYRLFWPGRGANNESGSGPGTPEPWPSVKPPDDEIRQASIDPVTGGTPAPLGASADASPAPQAATREARPAPTEAAIRSAAQARAVLARILPGTAVGVVVGALLLWGLHQQKELVGALIRIKK